MGEQRTLAGEAWSAKTKVTKRERFLAEMNAVIPWAELRALIAPHYPKPGRGRTHIDVSVPADAVVELAVPGLIEDESLPFPPVEIW